MAKGTKQRIPEAALDMTCQETSEGSLRGIHGYIVYDMYYNA